jgi:uncharacterized protein (UPF0276 family)
MIPIGLTLQPDPQFLALLDEQIENSVDYYEVAPETLWRQDERGALSPNGFHRRFSGLAARSGRPFVAHGVGFSLGSAAAADALRRRRWLARLRADQNVFQFRWYTDHLGATSLDGLAMTLPLPLPMTAHAATVVRRRLRALQRVVADVGVENNVAYFLLGDPLDEPAFLARIVDAPATHLLLDLHNLYTMAHNFGFDAEAYLARIDLRRVIELHVSGGADSDPRWLPSGRVLRLDSHDRAVPEAVWRLCEEVVPRCPSLRGITLERMEGTVTANDVPSIAEELRRLRGIANK